MEGYKLPLIKIWKHAIVKEKYVQTRYRQHKLIRTKQKITQDTYGKYNYCSRIRENIRRSIAKVLNHD